MKFFQKAVVPPQGNPEQWTTDEAKAWLKTKGLWTKAHKEKFRGITGQADSLQAKLGNGHDSSIWWEHISGLQKEAQKYKPLPIAEPAPPPPPPPQAPTATEEAERNDGNDVVDQPDSQHAPTPKPKPSVKFSLAPLILDTPSKTSQQDQSSVLPKSYSGGPSPNQTSLMANLAALPGLKDYAQQLLPWTNSEDAHEVVAFLTQLGNKVGAGISAALAAQPLYGQVFGSVMQLDELAAQAIVSKDNCYKVAGFGQDILRILDAAGKKNVFTTEVVLGSMIVHLQEAMRLVECLGKPGWLLHVVCNERLKEQFDAVHNQLVEILQAEQLDTLPSGLHVLRADYRDIVRHVRRIVKQHGQGDVTAGLNAMRKNDRILQDLARFFEVTNQTLKKELDAIPETEINVELLYKSYVAGSDFAKADEEAKNAMYLEVFSWYDKDGDNAINLEEMRAVMEDLGMLESRKPMEAEQFIISNFRVADKDGDGRVNFSEFCKFYNTLVMSKARQNLRFKLGLKIEDDLRSTFYNFASFGTRGPLSVDMDGQHFAKLCKNCCLMDRKLTLTDVDLIFAKAKRKGERRITFDQFLDALQQIADKKGLLLDEVVHAILKTGGPEVNATHAEYNRFHDDKSTYTGVYARGGPKSVDAPRTLASLLDRSPADVRGVKIQNSPSNNHTVRGSPAQAPEQRESGAIERERSMAFGGARPTPPKDSRPSSAVPASQAGKAVSPSPMAQDTPKQQDAHSKERSVVSPATPKSAAGARPGIYAAFAEMAGAADDGQAPPVMDDARFVDMCRKASLVGEHLKAEDAQAIYAKAKGKDESGLSFPMFLCALELVAEHMQCTTAQVYETVTAFTSLAK